MPKQYESSGVRFELLAAKHIIRSSSYAGLFFSVSSIVENLRWPRGNWLTRQDAQDRL